MPPPENQNENKTSSSMNIKDAFLAAANRKRKASSPNLPKKCLKVADGVKIVKEASDDDIEILSCNNDIAVGECKENTDLNVCKGDLNSLSSEKETSPLKSVPEKLLKSQSDVSESDLSPESSDELNSSNLNNSLSATFSNDQCENGDAHSGTEASPISKKPQINEQGTPSTDLCKKDAPSKRKKKMTADEAKKKSEEREQKRKELCTKKKTLNAEKLKRKLEKEQRRIEKEREKERKENERKEKERLRLEKKEQEEKERQQKLKEKEDQKKIKQMQLEIKLEEKKKKEELRLKREEEIKKAEEEKQKAKLEKEQKEKEKLERNKAAFMKFFFTSNKSSTTPAAPQIVKQELAFKPFQVSDDMTLAPVVPPVAQQRFNKEKLDNEFKLQNCKDLYLQTLKSGTYKDIRLRKRLKKPCDDVIVIDNSDSGLYLKAKLLQFSENVRPPFWGTWRKKSAKITPRNPFGEDEVFDYSIDSDDEWDEGGPGESLSGTENEVESEDDYEVDNEFFVPHGYLSAEEEEMDDEVDDGVEADPEKKEAKLTLKQQEFDMERKKKTTVLKPLILACYSENSEESPDSELCTLLQTYTDAGEAMCEAPILTSFTVKKFESESKSQSNVNTPVNSSSNKAKIFPEEAMPHLIRLVHGNTCKRERLCNEFQAFWHLHGTPPSNEENPKDPNSDTPTSSSRNISKRQFFRLLKTIATYGKISNPAVKKCCWYVQDEVREKFGLLDAPIPNQWTYVSAEKETADVTAPPVVSKSNCGSIKGFLKP